MNMKGTLRILAILVILDILGSGALWFGYSTMGAKSEEAVKLRQELAGERQKAGQFVTLRKILKQAQKERDVINKYLYDPGEESQINFVSAIETLGIPSTGLFVKTNSLDFVPGEAPSFRGEFALKGTWQEMYHFLRLIEEFPARTIIRRFNVSLLDEKNVTTALWNGAIGIDLTSIKGT